MNTDGADREAQAATRATPIDTELAKAQPVSRNGVPRVERTRHIVATAADKVEACVVTAACRRQENTIAVAVTRYLHTVNAVLPRPLRCSIVAVIQFSYLI